MEKKAIVVILGAIYNDKNEVLISQRNDPKVPEAHLKWDLIGGKNEFGESPEETIIREALEETGLVIAMESLLPEATSKVWQHDDYLSHVLVICYKCKIIGGKLESRDPKIADLKWVQVGELDSYDFLPTTQPFIDLVK